MISLRSWLESVSPSSKVLQWPSRLLVVSAVGDFLHHGGGGSPRLIVGCLAHLGLHFGIVHDGWLGLGHGRYHMWSCRLTILHLTHASLQVVDAEVAHLVAKIVPIHGCGMWSVVMLRADNCHAAVLLAQQQQPARCR